MEETGREREREIERKRETGDEIARVRGRKTGQE